ncbi:MAG: homocysteine S-methyltransferase family protein [Anaerolineae bacterium]
MTRTERFLAQLQKGEVLLADGATGTMLQRWGLEPGQSPETWLFAHPERIRDLHRGYLDAGSDLVLTCTFGGTRYRLEGGGLADRVVEVNRRAAELAREVAGDAFVGGDMGPTGRLLTPLGDGSPEEVATAYAEQAQGLVEGGADFLLIETMSDLGEAKAALEGARRVSDLPIITTFSFDSHGRTMMGTRPAQVAQEMAPLALGLGANCGKDPAEYVGFMHDMCAAAPGAILWAKPNAGLPHVVGDEDIYDATPEYMAQVAKDLRKAGAQIIGGCCGTTPQHIEAMAQALDKR